MSLAGSGAARHGRSGYILMELVAALALIGLLITFAYPAVTQSTDRTRLHALSTDVATLLRDARTGAVAAGGDAVAVFDRRRRTIQAGTRVVTVPSDVEVSVLAGSRCDAGGDRIRLVFRADGSSCGGVFRFAQGARAARVRVNWLTGHVEVLAGG